MALNEQNALLISRRRFLVAASLTGGALMVGSLPLEGLASPQADAERFGAFGPFLRIDADSLVTVIAKHSEMGQGAHTGLAALVAEELDADWAQVRVEMAPSDPTVYGHTRIKKQITGGSTTISNSWLQLRKVGASARAMFVQAAAKQWSVSADSIDVENGRVRHAASGRSARFGELLAGAAAQTPPAEPTLKSPDQFRLLGSDKLNRLDASDKSTGQETFTQDVRLPGMVYAAVAQPPRFGGSVKRVDDSAARKVRGVLQVFTIPGGVAVVAKNTHAAFKGRKALTVEWDDSDAEMRSSDEILDDYRTLLENPDAGPWRAFESKGERAAALSTSDASAEFHFVSPYLAHASMEPMNCVAQVQGKRARLTFGAQNQTMDQENVAKVIGGKAEDVEIVTLPCGGSFGRRSVADSDYQLMAVHIAKKLGDFTPVKLVWSREDDMASGFYRAPAHHRVRVAVDDAGYPTAWQHRIVTPSILANSPLAAAVKGRVDHTSVEGVQHSPYFSAIADVDARLLSPDTKVPILWLRSVGSTHTAMAMEHSIDQLAQRAGIDPLAYRRELYQRGKQDRHLGVLALVEEKSGWGKPLDEGWTRGLAVHECFGSVVANVVEVQLRDGEPVVRRVVVAVDCGIAVVPDQIRAQMEGGVNYGLSYSLFGEVNMDKGLVQNQNFHNYRVLRMNEAPHVETYIVPSANNPTGCGEPGTPVVGPAVANALLAITGKPTERLPFVKA